VPHNNVPLTDTRDELLKRLRRLWGFGIRLETIGVDSKITSTEECAG